MARQSADGSAAYDLYRVPQWGGSAAPQMPELPDLPEPKKQQTETVVVRARAEISVVAILGFLVVLGLLVMVVSGYVRLYELSSQHTKLASELEELYAENGRLDASYEARLDMEQIEAVASAELGMHVPTEQQIVYLDLSGEDSAVIYDSDTMNVGSVYQALKSSLNYLMDSVRAYFS